MKKIILLIICVIYSLTSIGQQIALSNTTSIDLPTRAEKLNKQQAISFAGNRFNNNKIALNTVNFFNTPHIYKIDNVLISLFTTTGSVEEDHLMKLKRGSDETSKKDKSYSSSIKVINNTRILVTNDIVGNVEYYRFFCFSNTNTSNVTAISGCLQFDKTDHDNGTNILNDILNSIKFTK
jgi:hypothetical protein